MTIILFSIRFENDCEKIMINEGIQQGEVVWYNDRRGYGFVSIGEDEIFIHRSALERFGLLYLHTGDKLTIEVGINNDGPAILEIRSVEREAPDSLPSDTSLRDNELRGIVKFLTRQRVMALSKSRAMRQNLMSLSTPELCKPADYAPLQRDRPYIWL